MLLGEYINYTAKNKCLANSCGKHYLVRHLKEFPIFNSNLR